MSSSPVLPAARSGRILLLSALFLAVAAAVGFDMYRLYTLEELWGYRPLWFLLSAWLGVVALRIGVRMRNKPFATHRLMQSTAAGVLLGVGFPDLLPLPVLLMVAWVPILLMIEDWRRHPAARKRELLPYLFHTFMLWNIIATYWVMNTSFAAGLFANIANSLLMLIPCVLFLWTQRYLPKLGYATLIAYWFAFEYIHLNWQLTWPWLTLGNGWAEYPSLIQWYTYTGVFGGGLWIWIVNILVFRIFQARRDGTVKAHSDWRLWWKPLAVLIVPMLISLAIYHTYEEQGETIDVVLVQPNFEPHYEKFERIKEHDQITRFIELSQTQLDNEVDYLVFPETSYGFVEEKKVRSNASTRRLIDAFADFPNLQLITGLNAYHDFEAGAPRTAATRTRERGGRQIDFEVMNLAAQIPMNPDLAPQTYRKSKLVPGPEKFPFRKLLFFMEPVVDQLGGTTAGLGTQPERSAFSSDIARVAPAICYESVFGEYFAAYVVQGRAQAAFIMTNDGWWDNTAGHRQHLYFASLRAIETRRAIGRSANTGISAFINQRGDILQPTLYEEATAIRGQMTLNDDITFYVQWQDLIARTALFLAIVLLLNTFVKSRLQKRQKI